MLSSVTLTAAVPTVEARLMNRISFSPYTKRLPLFGYGCLGGVAGLARVSDYVKANPKAAAIMFAGELPSGLWQGSLQLDLQFLAAQLPENPGLYKDLISTIITAALFGDGTAAVLLVGDEHPLAQPGKPRIIDSRSIVLPNTIHLTGMEMADSGFRHIFRPEAYEYTAAGIKEIVEQLCAAHNLSIDQIQEWIVHPGGPDVIKIIQTEFDLDDATVQKSWDTLAKFGNFSSAAVLYILDQLSPQPPRGTYGIAIATGPGISREAILLQW